MTTYDPNLNYCDACDEPCVPVSGPAVSRLTREGRTVATTMTSDCCGAHFTHGRECQHAQTPARRHYRRGSDVSQSAERAYHSDEIPF